MPIDDKRLHQAAPAQALSEDGLDTRMNSKLRHVPDSRITQTRINTKARGTHHELLSEGKNRPYTDDCDDKGTPGGRN